MLGRELVAEAAAHTRIEPPTVDGEPVLSVRAMGGAELAPFNLDVHPGEVVGVAGLTGSGRDELASLLAGRIDRTASSASAGGRSRPATPARRSTPASATSRRTGPTTPCSAWRRCGRT